MVAKPENSIERLTYKVGEILLKVEQHAKDMETGEKILKKTIRELLEVQHLFKRIPETENRKNGKE